MSASFTHVRQHWNVSPAADPAGRLGFSEMPFGDSPVRCELTCLNYVHEGVEHYEIDGRSVVVQAGEFILVEPGKTARVIIPRREITRALCVFLPGKPRQASDARTGLFKFKARHSPLGRRLEAVSDLLVRNPSAGHALAEDTVWQAAHDLSDLTERTALASRRIAALNPLTRARLLFKIEMARDYLHDNLRKPISLDELAAVAAISSFHLARTFKAVFGVSPVRYHARLRLQAAAAELSSGTMNVIGAATAFGFADRATFSRAFRTQFGFSPVNMMPGKSEGADSRDGQAAERA